MFELNVNAVLNSTLYKFHTKSLKYSLQLNYPILAIV